MTEKCENCEKYKKELDEIKEQFYRNELTDEDFDDILGESDD